MKHKFKKGDWVRNTGSIAPRVFRYSIKDLEYDMKYGANQCDKLWEPQPNEWCWFWNDDKQPFLAQLAFSEDDDNTTIYWSIQGLHGSYANLSDATYSWKYCQPFIGELPESYKDKL